MKVVLSVEKQIAKHALTCNHIAKRLVNSQVAFKFDHVIGNFVLIFYIYWSTLRDFLKLHLVCMKIFAYCFQESKGTGKLVLPHRLLTINQSDCRADTTVKGFIWANISTSTTSLLYS